MDPSRPTEVNEIELATRAGAAEEYVPAAQPGGMAAAVPRILLVLIAAAGAVAYAWSLNTTGLETFYAAGVRSMAESWHAFFYNAFDPHATITLDKLPGALWIQALFVRCFGYSVWAMVLPQVIEATLTVLVLYRAVRRTAGTAAGLTAAAILAASPVTVGFARGNLSDPLFVLCVVLAADATLRAVTTGRTRSWYAAMAWVALGFQAKMTEAWLVLPILGLALIVAAPAGRWRVAARAALGTLLAAALSLVWMLGFALTPAADRPYADGSKGNSVFQQVFDYNGMLRFVSSPEDSFKPLAPPSPGAEDIAIDNAQESTGLFSPASVTKPGWDRLLTGALAPECDWFLLLAMGGAAATFIARRRAERGDPTRAATALWSAWLVAYAAALSGAHLVQGYYLAVLVPATAALAGTGVWILWRAARAGSVRAGVALATLIAGQAAWSAWLVHGTYALLSWLILAAAAIASSGWLLAVSTRRDSARPVDGRRSELLPDVLRRIAAVAAALALAAGPVAAITWLEARAGGPFDAPLSAGGTFAKPTQAERIARLEVQGAYGGSIHPQYPSGAWPGFMHQGSVEQLQQWDRGTEILVFSSAEASDYVMYGVSSIQPVGGFTGNVPYPSVDQVRQLIETGKISFAVLPSVDVLTANDPRVRAVEELCIASPRPTESTSYVLYSCRKWVH